MIKICDMRPPPHLTQRESEIVPLLARGLNRAEIAQHFDVSEETIKKHTSNILSKFDAISQRDAFQHLRDYAEYYAQPSPAYNLYAHSVNASCIVDVNAKTLSLKFISDLECVFGDIDHARQRVLPDDDKILFFEINGVAPKYLGNELGYDIYESSFDPPLKKGDRVVRTVDLIFDVSRSVTRNSYFCTWVTYPSASLCYTLEFVGISVPKKIAPEVRANQIEIEDKTINWIALENGGRMFTAQPQLSYTYVIRWEY